MYKVSSVYRSLGIVVLAAVAISACNDTPTGTTTVFDATQVLADVPNKVIVATYSDLVAKSSALVSAVQTLNSAPTATNFDVARQAWRDARRPWEQSEAFLFGPVETDGVDSGIDSWPVNKTDLDAVLAGTATLNKEYIDGLEGTLKGFHTIEYLLFGANDSKTVSDLTSREREYLIGVTQSLNGAVQRLYQDWSSAGGNYVGQMVNAGTSGSVYVSQKAAVEELINGMIGICDEVANGKINDPFSQQDRSLEESQFSDNSMSDFADNIRSIQNVYLGNFGSNSGSGISALVARKNPDTDTKVRQQIQGAIDAIGRMTPTFGEAMFTNKSAVTAAQDSLRSLKESLQSQVMTLALSN